jgi:hypothetical protein
MLHQICVTPFERDAFGFNVKFCRERVSLPGWSVALHDRWPSALRSRLRKMGCSLEQAKVIAEIVFLGERSAEICFVDRDGKVEAMDDDRWPSEEEDEDEDDEAIDILMLLQSMKTSVEEQKTTEE